MTFKLEQIAERHAEKSDAACLNQLSTPDTGVVFALAAVTVHDSVRVSAHGFVYLVANRGYFQLKAHSVRQIPKEAAFWRPARWLRCICFAGSVPPPGVMVMTVEPNDTTPLA
jgi:hypothetical protein